MELYGRLSQDRMYSSPIRIGSIAYDNRLGIAAGFDKDGMAIRGIQSLGFGFMELGAVTPLPQCGNPSPRVFRLKSDGALINRLGFNNNGVEALVSRLRSFNDAKNSHRLST